MHCKPLTYARFWDNDMLFGMDLPLDMHITIENFILLLLKTYYVNFGIRI